MFGTFLKNMLMQARVVQIIIVHRLRINRCGVIRLMDRVRWWSVAYLCLRQDDQYQGSIEIFRGQLVDAVYCALGRPEADRSRLFIYSNMFEQELSWAEIVGLSERPDFPIVI